VSLGERIERLEDRERRLLVILALVGFAIIVLLVPVGVTALLHGSRSENDALRDAIAQITTSRAEVEKSRAVRQVIEGRYASPAPPLASLLAGVGAEVGVAIPETQDRQPVPHGKRYEEKATKISLRKVGMLKLARFMERIEQAGFPISISLLTIRKRGTEPDSYDVEMVVSAFERKPDKPAAGDDAKAGATEEQP